MTDDRPPLPPRGPLMNLHQLRSKTQLDGYGPYSQVPTPKPVQATASGITPPPYRMPPYPLPPLPGAGAINDNVASAAPGVAYHTHSNKFPIDREVVLNSGEKNNKIPILSEYNKRQRSAVAPEGPVKQVAWTESSQQVPESSYISFQGSPSARHSLSDIERCGPPRDDKTKITKTYYTIKDMISNRFSKSRESVDEQKQMNNKSTDGMTASMQGMSLAPRPTGRPIPPLPVVRSPPAHPNFASGSEILSPVLPSTPLSAQQQQRRIMQQQQQSVGVSPDPHGVYATARACLVQTKPPAQRRPIHRIPGPPTELSVSSPNLTANLEQNGVYISKTPAKYPIQSQDSDTNDDGGFKNYFHPPEPEPKSVPITDKENEEPMEKEKSVEDPGGGCEKVSSAPSSDYEKATTRGSSLGDSGRGSAAYSSGRPGSVELPTRNNNTVNSNNRPMDKVPLSTPNDSAESANRSKEWVDMVETELRQILDPKMQMGGCSSTLSDSVSSLTPPLPPLSPGGGSSPTPTPRHMRFKHSSLPYSSKPEYSEKDAKYAKGQRGSSQQRREWSRQGKNTEKLRSLSGGPSRSSRGFAGLDTDLGSTTTGPLDSVLDSRLSLHSSDEDLSTTIDANDALAIRRQLQGLESMYSEVLKLLGIKKHKYQVADSRTKRRYGSMSSLPSSVSSRPVRDKRRDDRKKVRDMKGINKRFQRLESHVVTLARSVAHLSSEMRTQHLMIQEMESIRGEMAALRAQTAAAARSQSVPRALNSMLASPGACTSGADAKDPSPLTNPQRVKKLTKFFGDEPPLLRLFLRRLGYEKYATIFDNERIGMVELPYLTEERLQKMGIPLGPRMRILQEAQISFCRDTVYVV